MVDADRRAWGPTPQRNGCPQKKQNMLSAFTEVPQFGQRFFVAAANAGGAGVGVGGVAAGRTNSIGGGGVAARGCTGAGAGGGAVGGWVGPAAWT